MSITLPPTHTSTTHTLPELTSIEREEEMGVRPRRWTTDEYHHAQEVGLFGTSERLELIDGEIYQKIGQNPPHSTALKLSIAALIQCFSGVNCHVHSQLPLTLPGTAFSEPEPDIAIVVGDVRQYATRHPEASEVLLLVEISDSTIWHDRRRKSPIYAEAGIPEYWILNLTARQLEVYRDPVQGIYQTTLTVDEDDTISPVAVPTASISLHDLLP